MKILVVDDEHDLLEQLRETLTNQRYNVDMADDGELALDKLFDNLYDLIILDIMLPKIDGLSVLREIRKAKVKTPKGTVEDKIQGLDYGADDYLAKPFAMAELMARIRSLLRRTSDHRDPLLTISDISLNTKTQQVNKKGLEYLLYNKNRVVSRFTLAEHVWGDEFDPFTMSNFIDVHIKNLRRKIGDADKKKIIRTVRGIGFIIEDEQE